MQSGDIGPASGLVWGRTDRPARMVVEGATTPGFGDARLLHRPDALENTDFTAKLDLRGLPPGQTVHYRVRFLDLRDLRSGASRSSVVPHAPGAARHPLAWAADTVGQGWGINREWGGIRIFEATTAGGAGISSSTPATSSMPTTGCPPRSRSPTARSGRTW